jgi:DNA-binding beta-propeller fold protein YncE
MTLVEKTLANGDGTWSRAERPSATVMAKGQFNAAVTAVAVFAANANRIFAEMKNGDAAISVFVGPDNTVTAANGYLVKAGEKISFDGYTGQVWVIAASGTPPISHISW